MLAAGAVASTVFTVTVAEAALPLPAVSFATSARIESVTSLLLSTGVTVAVYSVALTAVKPISTALDTVISLEEKSDTA